MVILSVLTLLALAVAGVPAWICWTVAGACLATEALWTWLKIWAVRHQKEMMNER